MGGCNDAPQDKFFLGIVKQTLKAKLRAKMRLIFCADDYTLFLYFINLIGELEAAKDKAFAKAVIFINNMIVMRSMYSLKLFEKIIF